MLEIKEFRCYETKIEGSEKAGSHQESNPGHPPTFTILYMYNCLGMSVKTDLSRPRSVDASSTNNSMDKVVMGTVGVHEMFGSLKALCDSRCVELANYKLSLRGES